MGFLRKLFGASRLDGAALASSTEKAEYAQIELLSRFQTRQPLHEAAEQQLWNRVLPQPYNDTIALLQKQGWLELNGNSGQVTALAQPFVTTYLARLADEKAAVLPKVRQALRQKDTSEALTIRRASEARQP